MSIGRDVICDKQCVELDTVDCSGVINALSRWRLRIEVVEGC